MPDANAQNIGMPSEWTPEQKLFPHQVGFTCPPHDWDAAPSDFLRISPASVGVHGWMLHVPDYRHKLDQRTQNFGMLEEFASLMANNGADVCAQVGSNWVHASGLGVQGVADFCKKLSDRHGFAFHMAGYAMVEALRAMNVEKVALNAVYHWPEWWQGTVDFLREAGFDVIWAGNFVDQGWFETQEDVNALRWIFDGDLAQRSFEYVAEKAPNADAYIANGMVNFRTGPGGLPQRILHVTPELEEMLGKPVIAHDTALYWRVFQSLDLAPIGNHGRLLEML
ncbi:MAG: hypothetical protein K5905_04205 [Roseibium sp.]|uniref:aspartate racemase/maleate isomerase family protein n=1 Tax=Roseibium sp. TaxID=1936156 RepID=UPI00261D88E5|nr:hypothetical protein [Roseibium sp.]MCV0424652.1 hypothetical protein [Roseibium sp.]